ncbi:tRNA synthetases class I protein superfamily, putative [Babesia bigemina]|uniref:isoleucine--tRNA ligase n=1 Tax=Babesia bigemina TaxID=5866 RepID=A0A061CZV7_BABBI|nr:tRNA synthetases class I protein superfamily, putative [Babesia bigemina]CDR94141.1 tRNA synthetases class I protein superfamily, putative [Babesia bigemina]|eukprot:XP_012766327.1 tRNA synthetases class I protein superfamily, putative [Babesia bigemina]
MRLRDSVLVHLILGALLCCDCYVIRRLNDAADAVLAVDRQYRTCGYSDGCRRTRYGAHPLQASGADEGSRQTALDETAIENTLNLPKTIWPKQKHFNKAAIERQARIQKFWKDHDIYRLLLERRLSKFEDKGLSDAKVAKRTTVILDGPPYANGSAHYGHFLNKTIKDVLLRAALLDGRLALFLPGWDCHGIPIESKVLGSSDYVLGDLRRGLTDAGVPRAVEVRQRCSQVATQSIQSQMSTFEMSGFWGFWKQFYATYHYNYERHVMNAFQELLRRGAIYRARCPQHYSAKSGSVLADSELVSDVRDILTAFVGFEVTEPDAILQALDFHRPLMDVRLVCWTTLPWTLPANRGVLLDSSADYDVYYANGSLYVLNNNDKFGLFEAKQHVGRLKGDLLLGLSIMNPVTGAQYKVHDHAGILRDKGTGIVHAAPAHGMVDFRLLTSSGDYQVVDNYVSDPNAICNIIDENERFYPNLHWMLEGLSIHDIDEERLSALLGDSLLKAKVERLPVDVDWRFGNRTHVRLTKQWCLMLRGRKACLERLNDIKMYPASSRNYLQNIITHRAQDWCLSRQRVWGTPIPVVYVDSKAIENPELAKLCDLTERFEDAGRGEYRAEVDIETLPPYDLGDRVFRKLDFRTDTVDVWFESALAQRVTMDRLRIIMSDMSRISAGKNHYTFRDLVPEYAVEGPDQFRGWYQSSLLLNTLLGSGGENEASATEAGSVLARRIITHGFVNDDRGNKLSKRNQNVAQKEGMEANGDVATATGQAPTDVVTSGGTKACETFSPSEVPSSIASANKACGDSARSDVEVDNDGDGLRLRKEQNSPKNSLASVDLTTMLGGEYYEDLQLLDLYAPRGVGADVMRLWACSSDFLQKDIQLNEDNLGEALDFAKKVSNFFKYAIGVTNDCKITNDRCRIKAERFNGLDLHFLKLSFDLVRDARHFYRVGSFHKIVRELEVFLTRLSNIYISYSKDRLYCDVKHGWRRTSAQIILRKIMRNVLGVVAPLMPHMAEDVYQTLSNVQLPVNRSDKRSVPSVFGGRWAQMPPYLAKVDVADRVERALELRSVLNASNMRRNDQKLVIVCGNDEILKSLLDLETNLQIDLRLLTGVAEVELALDSSSYKGGEALMRGNGYTAYFIPAAFDKCKRCWLYREDVSEGLCDRCSAICGHPLSAETAREPAASNDDIDGVSQAYVVEDGASSEVEDYLATESGDGEEEVDDDTYGYDDDV